MYEISPELKPEQKQVIYGTILGGSSIVTQPNGRNSYLYMKDIDDEWIIYKCNILKDFFKMPFKVKTVSSIAYPIFNEIKKIFYDIYENKIVSNEILNSLDKLGIMIWFVDAGKKVNNQAILKTNKFGENGSKLIADYFNSLNCYCEAILNKKTHEVVFSKEGTEELFKIIEIPDFMIEKIVK